MSKKNKLSEIITDNKENAEKLSAADKKVDFDKDEIEKKISKLILENKQNSKELCAAYKIITKQKKEIEKRRVDLIIAKKELAHKAELTIVNKELTHQIEKRKQTESILKESNEKYSKAFHSAPYAIMVTNIDDEKFIEVNDTFFSVTGYTTKEALSDSTLGLNIWVDKEKRVSIIDTLHSGKDINEEEFQFRKKNGEIRNGLFSARTIRINKKSYMLSSILDTTKQVKAHDLLKESEQKSMSIMENSADAIFLTNQQGKYIYTNKEVSAMLGYTSEEMKSKTIADISPPNKIEEYFKFFKQLLNQGKGFTEIELLKKDGSYISTDLNTVLLPDGTIYGSCRDITERKKTESELIKAKEHAEEGDRLKSAFLCNMSHEIRTPMNGILGFAQLLREPDLTGEEQQKFLGIIEKSGARMLNIITDIVSISKIESGQMEISISETNVNEGIDFVYNFFKPVVEKNGIQLFAKNVLPLKEAIIKTDREKIIAILTNLVGNATKFTHTGFIEFGYEKKDKYLEFFVKDTGVGIDDEKKEIIFERFRQGSESSYSREYEGAGLGLSISKAYVEMLGGKIWVESELGKGSTFYFTIPYNVDMEAKPAIKNVIANIEADHKVKNLKVLIAEDDDASVSFLSTALKPLCREILKAGTGVEAVEACRNNPDIDLVLMDVRMPDMDGYEATRQIRQFNKDVIIIAQTAYAFAGDREKAIEAGCNDHIAKPIRFDVLKGLIQKHFQ